MDWTIAAYAGTVVFSNLCWAIAWVVRERTNLEQSKLIASKSLSEYSFLKKAEGRKGKVESRDPEADGYSSIWETENEQG